MNSAVQVVVFDAAPASAQALRERLCGQGMAATQCDLARAAQDPSWGEPDVAVLVVGDAVDHALAKPTARLLERLVAAKVATLVWGSSDNLRWAGGPHVEWLAPEVGLDEVAGRLSTLARYVPLVRALEREIQHLHRLGEQLNRYFGEIDQEMRLAGRLQRDFLPRQLPDLPGLKFAALYRPASWVSGDLYDVFRIDEGRVGVFIADAMGHGVAAGLLTMFLRHALVSTENASGAPAVASPVAALTELHKCLVRQRLPNCEFVTAAYGIYDIRRHELWLARAGHPYPLLVQANGEVEPIRVCGGLLGLPDLAPEFDDMRLTLVPGDKVLFYTDGLDEDFFTGRPNDSRPRGITPALRAWARLDVRGLVEALGEHLDTKEGSLNPSDDITLLAFEVLA